MSITFHYKNMACVDASDSFHCTFYNFDRYQNSSPENIQYEHPPTWFNTSGCVDDEHTEVSFAGRYIFEWEAVRGGNETNGIDTFLVAPNKSNTINMFW